MTSTPVLGSVVTAPGKNTTEPPVRQLTLRLDPVSAYLATECQHPIVALDGLEGFVMITKALVEECRLKIVEKEQAGPLGHVLLVGAKTYQVGNRLATGAEWVVPCP